MTSLHAKKQPSAIAIEGEDPDSVRRTGSEKGSLPEGSGKNPNAEKLLWPFWKFSVHEVNWRETDRADGRIHQEAGTNLIFVVGESGSGKTTLLGEITGQDLMVGHSHKSGTLGHSVLPAIVYGRKYIFVDTPGFGAADLNNRKVYEDIMSCLFALGDLVNIAGVMFVHDVRGNRLTDGEMKTIRWLHCFCGPQFFQNITVVMSQWDRVNEDDMDQTREIAKGIADSAFHNILSPSYADGGCVYNHGILSEDEFEWHTLSMRKKNQKRVQIAEDFIRSRYEQVDEAPRLQVLEELAQGWGLYETEAAKCLFGSSTSSDVYGLRQKAILLDIDQQITPKPKEVQPPKSEAEPWSENRESRPPDETMWNWWDIAKQVAWTFWDFKARRQTKFTEYANSLNSTVWEALKIGGRGRSRLQ